MTSPGPRLARAFVGLVLAGACVVSLACTRERTPPPPGVLTLTATEQQAAWTRNFNPLVPGSRWPSAGGIYEPLLVYNAVAARWTPWLATAWAFEDRNLTLRFALREGVRFSDGAPFGPADVVFTFELLRKFPALDTRAVWTFVERVEATGPSEVTFKFARPYVPGLVFVAHQPIVPAHVWRDVADPVSFANPEPIATGPFTTVRVFRNQLYELGRNPRYWQPGKPAIEAIRLPAYAGNDQANLALVNGELDWAGNFVPSVERVFVRRDPVHHHHWFPPLGGTVFLYANTAKAPYGDVRVRRALSQAIDRALLVEVAMQGYTKPSDATGLSDAYASYRDPDLAASGESMTFDPVAAGRSLDAAGFVRAEDGVRRGPDGAALRPVIEVVNGWSDWVRAAQVVARGLSAIGVDASVRLYDQSAWFERLQSGRFELAIAWSQEGPTPYDFYRWLMHPETVKPIGEAAAGNWHRYGSEASRAAFDGLEKTSEDAEIRRFSRVLQERFVAELPAIPLFPNPSWGEFNDTRFTGFPDASHPYAALSPHKVPECLLVLTALEPRRGAAP